MNRWTRTGVPASIDSMAAATARPVKGGGCDGTARRSRAISVAWRRADRAPCRAVRATPELRAIPHEQPRQLAPPPLPWPLPALLRCRALPVPPAQRTLALRVGPRTDTPDTPASAEPEPEARLVIRKRNRTGSLGSCTEMQCDGKKLLSHAHIVHWIHLKLTSMRRPTRHAAAPGAAAHILALWARHHAHAVQHANSESLAHALRLPFGSLSPSPSLSSGLQIGSRAAGAALIPIA